MQRLVPTARLINAQNVLSKLPRSILGRRNLSVTSTKKIGRACSIEMDSYKNKILIDSMKPSGYLNFTNKSYYSANAFPPHEIINLPALSPTMEQGTIASWAKKEGDHIMEGDLIAEIETDKATMGLEASDEGYLAKILIPEKTKDIPLKTVIILISNKKPMN